MAHNHSSPEPTFPIDVQVLLEEGTWIRRLASGLVNDEQLAEDVTQDVFIEALAKAPRLSGPQLRGWLATLTRRIASHMRDRERDRAYVERRSARQEVLDSGSRLDLHRRLAIAMGEVPEPYRTALTMRYFDELQPRDIAARLQITTTAARKRVSRGLGLLREVLDRDFEGGREQWLAALVPLSLSMSTSPTPVDPGGDPRALDPPLTEASALPQTPAPLAGTALPGITFSLAMLTKTKLAALALLLTLLGAALYVQPWNPKPLNLGLDLPNEHVVLSLVQPSEDQDLPQSLVADPTSSGLEASRQAIAINSQPQVRVVDVHGNALADVAVGWVDHAHYPHVLELDSEGMVNRPEGSGSARFFAYAEGIGSAALVAGPDDEDLLIQLDPGRTVRGRVIENGGSPVRPICLELELADVEGGLGFQEQVAWDALLKAGAAQENTGVWTDENGDFVLEGVPQSGRNLIVVPETHHLLDLQDDSPYPYDWSFWIPDDEDEVVLRFSRQPSVYGRVLLEGSGEPATGQVMARLDGLLPDESEARSWSQIRFDGSFSMPLPWPASWNELSASERKARAESLRISAGLLSTRVFGSPQSAAPLERRGARVFAEGVPILDMTAPIDLGTLYVPNPKLVLVRVLAPNGVPIANATVASDLGTGKTDAEGLVVLPANSGSTVRALAIGFSLGVMDLPRDLVDGGEAPPLVLEPGVRFAIDLGRSPSAQVFPELLWKNAPFEGAKLESDPAIAFPRIVHSAFHQTWPRGSSSSSSPGAPGKLRFAAPSDGNLEVPGLRAGAEFSVRLVDLLGQVLLEQDVVLPGQGQSLEVPMILDESEFTQLHVRVVDPEGEFVPGARVFAYSDNGSPIEQFNCAGKQRLFGPLARGANRLEFSAPRFMQKTLLAYECSGQEQQLEVVLQPSRRLRVTALDESGAVVIPDSITLSDSQGWRETVWIPESTTLFRSAPVGALQIEAKLGTEVYSSEVARDGSEATIFLPGVQEVELAWLDLQLPANG